MSLRNNPFTLLIHIALATIVAGALVTHFFGIQGKITLLENTPPTTEFIKSSGPGDGHFPFGLQLLRSETLYYPGTTTPMDFKSVIKAGDRTFTVAMNAVAETDGWRFYQTGMGDGQSTLSVSHDPWGIGITYTGYSLLAIGMIGFLCQRKSLWRSFIRRRAAASLILISLFPLANNATDRLPTMQRPLARNFGKIHVYWNDRICPIRTMAMDVCAELYGSTSYRGMTAEQVLAGWLFYYDEWVSDYDSNHPAPTSEKARKKDEQRRALIRWVGSGEAFRIYPYHAATGRMEWLSLSGSRPSRMSLPQWQFMTTSMRDISSNLRHGRNIEANNCITALIDGQKHYAGENVLPTSFRFRCELIYDEYVRLFPAGGLMFVAALSVIFFARSLRRSRLLSVSFSLAAWLYLGTVLALRGIIGAHIPLSNGCETMLFMGFAAVTGALFARDNFIAGSLILVAATAALVAAMSSKTPQIASLMPVLSSPLLSIHVMLVMCAYTGCMLMAILAAISLIKGGSIAAELTCLNRIILIPTLFLLTAGIFVGAVWANQSWGRYWGWDPKETCALVTMLIYAIPAHTRSLKWFRDNRNLDIYLLIAILSVAFTYFGANYLLPGLHSYA